MHKNLLLKLKKLENDPDRLGSLLVKTIKETDEYSSELKSIYASYINHKDFSVRHAAVFGLFYRIKSTDPDIKTIALNFVVNKNEEFIVRTFSISGLAITYFGTKDLEILKSFYHVMKDSEEDILLRNTSCKGILQLMGIDIRTLMIKMVDTADENYIEVSIKKFKKEFMEVVSLLGI